MSSLRASTPKWMFSFFLLFVGALLLNTGGCDCGGPSGEKKKETIKKDGSSESIPEGSEAVLDDGVPGCNTRCDCPQGQECQSGQCIVPTVPVYCCDRAECPPGQACVDAQGQNGVCQERPSCQHRCDCNQGLDCVDGKCTATNPTVYCCEKSGCPAGQVCIMRDNTTKTCGGEGSPCNSACDCLQGLGCVGSVCTKGSTPVYCCDNPGCPKGEACETQSGGQSTCGEPGQPCNNTCECPAGQPCVNGRCKQQAVPVYCCDDPANCPAGQLCETKDGKRQTCASTPTCKEHCDCAQGQFCEKGTCKVGPSPVYCCDKPGCPANKPCYKSDGSVGSCPGQKCANDLECGKPSCQQQGTNCAQATPTCRPDGRCTNETKSGPGVCDPTSGLCNFSPPQCKTHCDCPQGLGCLNSKCVPASSKQYFCCDKPGCPAGKACYHKDGSPGICKSAPACKEDKECGVPSCKIGSGSSCEEYRPRCVNGKCAGTTARYSPSCVDIGSGCVQTLYKCGSGGKCQKVSQPGPPGSNCNPATGVCKMSVQCQTHCDCMQGLACTNGQCIGGTVPVYCCDKPGCPAGKACTHKDGSSGKCPTSSKCKTNLDCGKPTCVQRGSMCEQRTPICNPSTGTCSSSGAAGPGVCDAATGTCKMTSCRTHCDCPQGQQCSPMGPMPGSGICRPTSPPTYCCDKAGCPAKSACYTKAGARSTCPGPCTSPCDCNAGEDCVGGKCIAGTKPVYCCDDPQNCPAGQYCKDKQNKSGTCPSKPRPCKNPCDCLQGEACTNNVCTTSSTPVYCCTKSGCPANKVCTHPNGSRGYCPIPCKTHCDCNQGDICRNGFCSTETYKYYCCSKPGCPAGYSCYNPNGSRGRCPQMKCTSPCDCNQGEDCRNNVCTRVNPAVYCCSKSGCPAGQACKDKNNQWKTCSSTAQCKSPCDCDQGKDCYRGQCVQVYPAVYCCDNPGCPAGQACYDKNNQPGSCPGTQCTTACDCRNQGQSCIRGRCVYATPRIYCCDKPGCRPGNPCEDKSGNMKTCPGTSCKTPCDCNQGEDCRGGICTRVSPPVYCCSKAGCYPGRPCVKTDGTSSTCPVQCKTRCDCNQGEDCYSGRCYRRSGAYCCDKPGCPSGQSCLDKNGQRGTCGGSTGTPCKIRCDCNQGEECQNGRCTKLSYPVYCCDKPGCPSNYVCKDKNDKAGWCLPTPPPPGP